MPESVFGIGCYACYDADYLRLNITDAPDKIGGLLEADGWTVGEYWTCDNYYAWTEDAICFDYQIYTAEDTGMPDVYPNGLVNISIYTSQRGFEQLLGD